MPNVLQIGAVCVGLWEGNCAKVLLPVCGGIVGEPVVIYLKPFLAWILKTNKKNGNNSKKRRNYRRNLS